MYFQEIQSLNTSVLHGGHFPNSQLNLKICNAMQSCRYQVGHPACRGQADLEHKTEKLSRDLLINKRTMRTSRQKQNRLQHTRRWQSSLRRQTAHCLAGPSTYVSGLDITDVTRDLVCYIYTSYTSYTSRVLKKRCNRAVISDICMGRVAFWTPCRQI